ncbi:MAG: hypothetical protein HY364_00935 [Candidatus Aenigmarchaeota archaeon]|nr:hypothetical protein [Candidatus Aenigmarchaeota archaeon]
MQLANILLVGRSPIQDIIAYRLQNGDHNAGYEPRGVDLPGYAGTVIIDADYCSGERMTKAVGRGFSRNVVVIYSNKSNIPIGLQANPSVSLLEKPFSLHDLEDRLFP